MPEPAVILFIEDNPADARLVSEVLRGSEFHSRLVHIDDSEKALSYLRREGAYARVERPSLILLDLNLPRRDGREFLAEIKNDDYLKHIPVVVLTTSKADHDVLRSYQLQANCYIVKPFDLSEVDSVIRAVEKFWLTVATLPVHM